MALRDILAMAKQGESDAIATLLNYVTKPKGIRAQVARRDDCLHVLLESPQPLNQHVIVTFVQNSIKTLQADSIATLKVYGREIGQKAIAWSQEIQLLWDNQSPDDGDDPPSSPSDLQMSPSVTEMSPLPSAPLETATDAAELSFETTAASAITDSLNDLTDSPLDDLPEDLSPLSLENPSMIDDLADSLLQGSPDPLSEPSINLPEESNDSAEELLSIDLLEESGDRTENSTIVLNNVPPAPPFDQPMDRPADNLSTPDLEQTTANASAQISVPDQPAAASDLPLASLSEEDQLTLFQRPEAVVLLLFIGVFFLWQLYLEFLEEEEAEAPETPLSSRELARRLGVTHKTISRRQEREDFPTWTQDLDPYGIAWVPEDGMFVPKPD